MPEQTIEVVSGCTLLRYLPERRVVVVTGEHGSVHVRDPEALVQFADAIRSQVQHDHPPKPKVHPPFSAPSLESSEDWGLKNKEA